MKSDKEFLERAVTLAEESVKQGGFPAGALVVKDGVIISEGISIGNILLDPTAHAESVAIREATKKLGTTNLEGSILYSSLEPCLMCFSAATWACISRNIHTTKKTQEMAQKFYYEGVNDIREINEKNNWKIVVEHNSDLESKSLELVKKWETVNISLS